MATDVGLADLPAVVHLCAFRRGCCAAVRGVDGVVQAAVGQKVFDLVGHVAAFDRVVESQYHQRFMASNPVQWLVP